jgi:hypothetical protein
MPMPPKELQKTGDQLLRLARESNDTRTKLALIEMATELRVMASAYSPMCALEGLPIRGA